MDKISSLYPAANPATGTVWSTHLTSAKATAQNLWSPPTKSNMLLRQSLGDTEDSDGQLRETQVNDLINREKISISANLEDSSTSTSKSRSILDTLDQNVGMEVASGSVSQLVTRSNMAGHSNSLNEEYAWTEKPHHDELSIPESKPDSPTSNKDPIYLGKLRLSLLFLSLCLSTLLISLNRTIIIPAMYQFSVHRLG